MSRNSMLGVIGGILIALAAMMTGTGLDFSTHALDTATMLVLFLAGLGVIIFILMGRHQLGGYCAVAATTILVIWVVDLFKADAFDITLKLIVLVVGVILALMAVVSHEHRH